MRIAGKLMRHKAQYLAVEARTGVPWFVIAALHSRESDADFATYLGNGERLDRKTMLVPKGRGPFDSWEAGAIDALALDGLDQVKTWSPERACFEIEKFNGFGYRKRGVRSPYLWSFSNHYARGKYVADGRFSATHVDEQCGAIPILKAIMELDGSARFKADNLPATKPITVTTILGGILGILAHLIGISPNAIAIILIAAFILAAVVYAFVRIRR
jgi:lysozyme family protein